MAVDHEALGRSILAQLHGITEPSAEQLAAAKQQVERDPDGSAWLADVGPGPVPDGRDDLRTARVRGAYLPALDD